MGSTSEPTRRWIERWTGFNQSEREGARSTTSKHVAFLIGLISTFLALLLAFRQQGVKFELGSVAVFMYIWAISVAGVGFHALALYFWGVKTISKRYFYYKKGIWGGARAGKSVLFTL